MSKRTLNQNLILAIFLGLAVLLLNSCAAITGYGGNPEPNIKTIHMATHHGSYTQQEYDNHPDHDCSYTEEQIKNLNK